MGDLAKSALAKDHEMKLFAFLAIPAVLAENEPFCAGKKKKVRDVLAKDAAEWAKAPAEHEALYNCPTAEDANNLFQKMTDAASGNNHIKAVQFYQCRKKKPDGEPESRNDKEKEKKPRNKVHMLVECQDGTFRKSK